MPGCLNTDQRIVNHEDRRRCQHTRHAPQVLNAYIAPTSLYLLFFIEAPNWLALVRNFVSAYLPDWVSTVSISDGRVEKQVDHRQTRTYPVAKMITSAGNSDPFSNLIPVFVKRSIRLSFFNLIFPSMTSWLAPVSVGKVVIVQSQ